MRRGRKRKRDRDRDRIIIRYKKKIAERKGEKKEKRSMRHIREREVRGREK